MELLGAAQWCACPAMVLLDILTDTRYGLGNHITDSSLDLFSFVTASKFANTLVDQMDLEDKKLDLVVM